MSLDPRISRKLRNLKARMQAHFVAWFAEMEDILAEDAGPTTLPADLGPDTSPEIRREERRRK